MLVSRFSIDGFKPKKQTLHNNHISCEFGVHAFVQGTENKMFLNHLPKDTQDKLSLWVGEIDDDAVVFANGIPQDEKWYKLKKIICGEMKNKPSQIFIPAESCFKIKNIKQINHFNWINCYDETTCEYELV